MTWSEDTLNDLVNVMLGELWNTGPEFTVRDPVLRDKALLAMVAMVGSDFKVAIRALKGIEQQLKVQNDLMRSASSDDDDTADD